MTFDQLNLNTPLLNALNDLGYTKPTTIQQKVFSVVMSGQDVVGIAQTGTGKTFAYLLPCLRQWKFSKDKSPQILILVPTRELVAQVVREIEKLSTYMNVVVAGIYGGTNIKPQIAQIEAGLDVLVATPGRLLELMLNGTLNSKTIKRLVIDEVDEMMNLGFRKQLTDILDLLPLKRQNLLFSATITDEVESLFVDYFNSPLKVEAAPTGTPLENIDQQGYSVPNFYTKINLLELLLSTDANMRKVLVFTATKQLADEVYEQITTVYPDEIGVIHSNKAQNNRFDTVKQFQIGTYRVIIATDIVARGLDVAEVTHVINFDLPPVPENYIHRIGRTGRADKKGIAISFITERDAENQEQIEALMNYAIPMLDLPSDLEISDILTEEEMPKINMKNILVKTPKREPAGPAFHEKLDKNKKVNNKIRRSEKMRLKYGKPQKRGQKGAKD